MQQERTEISTLGEFGLIQHLTKNNEIRQAGTMLSVGDDAAVIDQFGKQCVISSDVLVEGIHFDLMYVPLKHLGYKAVVVNLSDIFSMNATPTHILVNIAVSNRFSVEALEEFYEGVYAACQRYHIDLIGGDTSGSQKGLFISVTAIGEVAPNQFVTRSGAKKGDLICVSGDLGAAYLGLQLLEREKQIFIENPKVQPNLDNRAYVVGRQLKPEARYDIIEWLTKNDIVPTAMMDISDGLSSELIHLCTQSKVGCEIYEEKIPFHQETKEVAFDFKLDPTACALSGGEDYELLFTVPQEAYEKIKFSEQISIVGYIKDEEEGMYINTRGGNKHPITAQGWVAFQ